jgi:hypothetical protein
MFTDLINPDTIVSEFKNSCKKLGVEAMHHTVIKKYIGGCQNYIIHMLSVKLNDQLTKKELDNIIDPHFRTVQNYESNQVWLLLNVSE